MRILVADDNREMRRLLTVALQSHDLIVAENGMEAVSLAQCFHPDVILMDVMMPEMDGFEALERLKADKNTADIPVVLMSAGKVLEADFKHGLALGAACYLAKPFSVFGLAERLASYIKK